MTAYYCVTTFDFDLHGKDKLGKVYRCSQDFITDTPFDKENWSDENSQDGEVHLANILRENKKVFRLNSFDFVDKDGLFGDKNASVAFHSLTPENGAKALVRYEEDFKAIGILWEVSSIGKAVNPDNYGKLEYWTENNFLKGSQGYFCSHLPYLYQNCSTLFPVPAYRKNQLQLSYEEVQDFIDFFQGKESLLWKLITGEGVLVKSEKSGKLKKKKGVLKEGLNGFNSFAYRKLGVDEWLNSKQRKQAIAEAEERKAPVEV